MWRGWGKGDGWGGDGHRQVLAERKRKIEKKNNGNELIKNLVWAGFTTQSVDDDEQFTWCNPGRRCDRWLLLRAF